MEELYLNIAERLAAMVPEIDHIDEDTGQLYPAQYDDRYEYPILFPCLLIDASTADWKPESHAGGQRGTVTVTLKLAFRCDEDSHYSSTERGNDFPQLKRRLAVGKKVVGALHGWCFEGDFGPMLRRQSRSYPLPGRVRVYETVFNVNMTDDLQVGE